MIRRSGCTSCTSPSDKGNAAAQYALGLAHLYGKDVARDIGEALWLLHWAAKQGHVEAQTFLSDLNDRVKAVAPCLRDRHGRSISPGPRRLRRSTWKKT